VIQGSIWIYSHICKGAFLLQKRNNKDGLSNAFLQILRRTIKEGRKGGRRKRRGKERWKDKEKSKKKTRQIRERMKYQKRRERERFLDVSINEYFRHIMSDLEYFRKLHKKPKVLQQMQTLK
jgi:hypothetical protein